MFPVAEVLQVNHRCERFDPFTTLLKNIHNMSSLEKKRMIMVDFDKAYFVRALFKKKEAGFNILDDVFQDVFFLNRVAETWGTSMCVIHLLYVCCISRLNACKANLLHA